MLPIISHEPFQHNFLKNENKLRINQNNSTNMEILQKGKEMKPQKQKA
jgi:hypothetical protein